MIDLDDDRYDMINHWTPEQLVRCLNCGRTFDLLDREGCECHAPTDEELRP